jgi:hypothetical protein
VARVAFAVTLAFLVVSSAPLRAQDPRGSLIGSITDPTEAAIPGVLVEATNQSTGTKVATTSNARGRFVIPYLLGGFYTVSAEADGFKRSSRESVQVRIGEVTEVGIQLELGSLTETIDVTEATPVLDTSTPSLGQVLDERRVVELPTLAGNAFELALLTPGVFNGTNLRDRKPAFNNGNSQISTDGSGTYNNEFQIDGVSNSFADGNSRARVAFSPPQTAIQEFKMQTSNYDAAIGHTLGSVVNVSTKSGTNELHGEAHWFVRNRAFDAPNFFNNKNGTEAPVYQDNRYGASVGGPVVLPNIYRGQNKTFFFYAYEANKWIVPGTFTGTVPTALQRDGDFSELLAAGSNFQIYNPLTTRTAANGRFQRDPVPNNIIPASLIDPVGRNLAALYPLPTSAGTSDGRNNFFNGSLKSAEDYYVHVGRIDHNFSDNYRVFGRYHYDFWEEDKNDHFANRINGIILNRINRGAAFDQVFVLGPTLLLNVRYGFTNQEFPERRVTQGFDLASLGFAPSLVSSIDPELATIPRTSLGGYSTLSPWESGDGTNTGVTHTWQGNFTKLLGTHNVKFGADFRIYRGFENRFPQSVSPDFAFANTYTRGPLDNSPAAPLGQEFAAMLFGVPAGSMAHSASYALQSTYLAFYLQDDFKMANNFTLNVGLRYEKEGPISERYNRLTAGFAEDVANPIDAAARANYANNPIPEIAPEDFRALGGLLFVDSSNRNPFETESNNFLPRIGFSWQVLPQTVVRAGYGVFFDLVGVNRSEAFQFGFSQSTPIQASLDSGLSFIANNANPFPSGLIPPLGAAGGLETNLGQGFDVYPEKRLNGYAQRWSFGLQQEVGKFLLESSYVGNRGTRLQINRRINETPIEYLSTSPTRDTATINYLSQQFPSPFRGTNPIFGANISRANLLKPYPHFGNIVSVNPQGYSWFHSLQSRIERRFSEGYTFGLSYTWSKTMEATEFINIADPVPYESLGGLDRPHRIALSGIYELPFGRGRKWLASAPSVVDHLVGGWQLNAVIIYQSGQALGFGNALFIGNVEDIPLEASERTAERWFNTGAGFNRASAQQLASNYRTFPLRFGGVRGDAQNRWDLSALKNFAITERVRLQFRAESFNALNSPIFNNPNTSPTSGSFGVITGTQAQARTFQFALKLEF